VTDPTIISITSQFDPRLAALLGWVVVLVKVLVDWLKTAAALPTWAPPGLAFAAAWVLIVVLMLALGIPLSAQLVAQAILCALIAAVLAIGQTALQSRTKANDITVAAIADELEARAAERAAASAQTGAA
jgi:hypothetical protein